MNHYIDDVMAKLEFSTRLRGAFQAMQTKAEDLNVSGVAGIMLSLEGDQRPLLEVCISDALPQGTVEEGYLTGGPTNILAQTLAILATMYSHKRDSGNYQLFTTVYENELHAQGGVCHQVDDSTHYLVAFSGGNGKKNVAIARAGLEFLLQNS